MLRGTVLDEQWLDVDVQFGGSTVEIVNTKPLD
jgi:hypothetical protein